MWWREMKQLENIILKDRNNSNAFYIYQVSLKYARYFLNIEKAL